MKSSRGYSGGCFARFFSPPFPVDDVRSINSMSERIFLSRDLLVPEVLQCRASYALQLRNMLDCIHGQGEPIDAIFNCQLQWSIDVPLFSIAVNMEVLMIGAAVGQSMNEPGISVEAEDDGFINREEQIKISVG